MAHAVADFAISAPELFQRWHKQSQYIVSLAAENKAELENLRDKLTHEGFQTIPFYEPDLDHALTSFAVVPHHQAKKRLSTLPLAGRGF